MVEAGRIADGGALPGGSQQASLGQVGKWWLRVEAGMPRWAWISPAGVPSMGPCTTARTTDRRP